MRFDLAAMASRNGYRRQNTEFRAIAPTNLLGQELARIYLANVAVWRDAVPHIVAQYASSLSSLQMDRAPVLEATIEEAEAVTQQPNRPPLGKIIAAIAAWLLRFEKWHRGQWIIVIRRTTIDLTPFIGPQDVSGIIETALARNTALIKDISAEAAGKISDIVFRGLQSKAPVADVAAELRTAVGFARKRSIRVAHDQMIKLSGALDVARFTQAGLTEYTWKHTPQPHPRLHHLARDGLVFKLGQPRGDEPGEAPFCRCYRVPVLRLPVQK